MTYVDAVQITTTLLSNQSDTITMLSEQLDVLRSQVEQGTTYLEAGFDRLTYVLSSTEERIASWDSSSRLWLFATIVGFLFSTFSSVIRWILIGTDLA